MLYFAVAMAVVTLVIAVTIDDDERGVHRSFKTDWFVGLGSACLALGYAASIWRLWAMFVRGDNARTG